MNDFKLDSRPNIKSGFKAPDSYFESLADRVMLNLPVEEVKVIPLFKRRRPIWVTSAAAVFVLSFTLLLNKNKTVETTAAPDAKAAESFVVNSNMSSNEWLDNLTLEDIKELKQSVIEVDDDYIGDQISASDINLSQI